MGGSVATAFEKLKKNWSHKLKHASSHYYENARCQNERQTHNH